MRFMQLLLRMVSLIVINATLSFGVVWLISHGHRSAQAKEALSIVLPLVILITLVYCLIQIYHYRRGA